MCNHVIRRQALPRENRPKTSSHALIRFDFDAQHHTIREFQSAKNDIRNKNKGKLSEEKHVALTESMLQFDLGV